MEKDLIINDLLSKIDKKLQELENEYDSNSHTFKTNCRFSYDNLMTKGNYDKTINIKTIRSIEDLIEIYAFINKKSSDFNDAYDKLSLKTPPIFKDYEKPEFKWCEYTLSEWENDIEIMIRRIVYNDQIRKLTEYKKTLEPLYSQDKKDQIIISNILSKLNF